MTIRVFLLDDHELVREGIRSLLESDQEIEVVGEATTAAEALTRVPLARADVAILDVRLEEGNGIEVCRELRSASPELDIGVARYDRHGEGNVAEVAFVVADDYQHHGIGSLLLDELVSAARDRGISTFLADTLWSSRYRTRRI
jgi:DNA-binding NarL/FixJ family response regulator